MIPLNATVVATVNAQQAAATRVPRSPTNATTDAEYKLVAATSRLSPSDVSNAPGTSSRHSLGGVSAHIGGSNSSSGMIASISSNSDTGGTRSSRRPILSIQTGVHCLCGEELCGFDCRFLQKEFQEITAAEHRRRHHRSRPRSRSRRSHLERAAMIGNGEDASTASDLTNGKSSDNGGTGYGSNDSDCESSDDCDNSNDEDDDAVADLERRFRRYYSNTHSARSTIEFDDLIAIPASLGDTAFMNGVNRIGDDDDVDDALCSVARFDMQRSKSCGVHSSEFDQKQLVRRHNAHRLRIGYRDEALRERSEKNTQALLQLAMISDPDNAASTATILARRALRYRKVLERMEGVDAADPSLDVNKCLGVHWQRVGSPEQ